MQEMESDHAGACAFAPLLALHQLVLDDARQMLEFASRARAAEFNQKRSLYLQRLAQLRNLRAGAALTVKQRGQLAAMLTELVVLDGQIRQYTEPRTAAIERWILPGKQAGQPFSSLGDQA